MKITCQACQSKYTIADDKIQGKVAKIRCRKCGATVLVDASSVSGGRENGSIAPAAASHEVWLVSVAEGDQRTMQLQEVVDAYNSGVITADTYLWKEGMGDWQPLSEIGEIVNALNEASAAAGTAEPADAGYQAPAPAAAAYTPPAAYSPPAVAARRETGRGRGDLFGGASAHEEEVATSAPPQVLARSGGSSSLFGGAATNEAPARSGLTGARDEQSVLFSLTALTNTSNKPASVPPGAAPSAGARNEDSGLIDLNALARAQQQTKVAEVPATPAATPFLFPAALGTVETFAAPEQQQKKSNMMMFVGLGLGVAGIAIGIAIWAGGKKDEAPTAPANAALSAVPTPAEAPATSAAANTETAPGDSAAPTTSAKVAVKQAPKGGAARPKPGAPQAAPVTPVPPPAPKAKSPCGCATGDLQCQIRCSATGK